jgi:aldose 1-epimerase
VIRLRSGDASATVVAELGAGLGMLEWQGIDILRPWSHQVEDGPFALGMNLLAPFSNRISVSFDWDGTRHAVEPNLSGEPFAIHGDAFQRGWTVLEASLDSVTLSVAGEIGPWRHVCRATWSLLPQMLGCSLEITNAGKIALPFGGGFHPWFPRSSGTQVAFRATGFWPEDARHLPASVAPMGLPSDLTWDLPRPLPTHWINAGFAGWDGHAAILQPDLRLKIASTGCATAILYSPGAGADFFCFEPVSHPVDAHNLPGHPGLVRLEPGETLNLTMSLVWDVP